MKCQYCHNGFSNKQNLNAHQRTAKYCLKIQGKTLTKEYKCDACLKTFPSSTKLRRHQTACSSSKLVIGLNKKIIELDKKIISLEERCKILLEDKLKLQASYEKLSLTAVKRPTISNKTMNINNFIKNMQPLKVQDIESSVPLLTLEHHAKGAEGYAEFALEFPFKDKIVCVDVSRNKIKYKNDDGDIIEDVGFRKMMVKLCKSLKDRSFNLSLEHEDKLSDTWTEKELESVDFMEAAVAIAKYAQGRENEFCNKIIKLISKGSTSPL